MPEIDSRPSDIPYLRTLRDRLWTRKSASIGAAAEAGSDAWEKLHLLNADLEQLPYTIQGSYESLMELAKAQQNLLERLDSDRKLEVNITYVVPEHERNALGYRLDTFIEISRRCQNATTLYVSRTLNIQLPASLRECADKIASKKLVLPEELSRLIIDYWTDCGKMLRDYRDLSQHHLLLSSDARAVRDSARNAFLYLVLPNNPAEKSMRRLKFTEPVVHALPYAVRAYQDLYRYCFLITSWLLGQTGEIVVEPATVNLLPRVPFGAPGGEPIQWIEPLRISGDCWRLREAMEGHVRDLLSNRERLPANLRQ